MKKWSISCVYLFTILSCVLNPLVIVALSEVLHIQDESGNHPEKLLFEFYFLYFLLKLENK